MTLRRITTLDSLRPGVTLGRYECLMPIARGGMAAVWAARIHGIRGFERIVALKTMLPALSEDPTFVSMFLDEARIASRIQHPNVASVIDLGEEGELLYLVMEWVDGEPLSVILRESGVRHVPIPIHVSARILVDACAGLHEAHELRDEDGRLVQLVHRDVSPQNILVSASGLVKIVDFGVAKVSQRSASDTAPGFMKGKLAYMAPEQAVGLPIDRRADIFALGVVFYQLLTGFHPFRGENDLQTLHNLTNNPVPTAGELGKASIPPRLEAVALRALSLRPDHRYATALELGRAIERAMGAHPLASSEEVATYGRTLLGNRAQERRDALRDAMVEADSGHMPHAPVDPSRMPSISSGSPHSISPGAVARPAGSEPHNAMVLASPVALLAPPRRPPPLPPKRKPPSLVQVSEPTRPDEIVLDSVLMIPEPRPTGMTSSVDTDDETLVPPPPAPRRGWKLAVGGVALLACLGVFARRQLVGLEATSVDAASARDASVELRPDPRQSAGSASVTAPAASVLAPASNASAASSGASKKNARPAPVKAAHPVSTPTPVVGAKGRWAQPVPTPGF